MVRTRRDARERALSLCYELDVRGSVLDDLLFELPVAPAPYAVELARGVEDHRDEIDAIITKFADRWSIDRMPVIDRNLLRIAVYELGWRPEIPLGVAGAAEHEHRRGLGREPRQRLTDLPPILTCLEQLLRIDDAIVLFSGLGHLALLPASRPLPRRRTR